MTVKQLINQLKEISHDCGDYDVYLSIDEEGNQLKSIDNNPIEIFERQKAIALFPTSFLLNL